MSQYAIFARPVVTIYDHPSETMPGTNGRVESAIGDEGLYGQVCRILSPAGEQGGDFIEIKTFYGYHGYVHAPEVVCMEEKALRSYLSGRFLQCGRTADVLTLPAVQGVRLEQLPRGALLRAVPGHAARSPEGWRAVYLVDGRLGYVWRPTVAAPLRYQMSSVFYLGGGRTVNEAAALAAGVAPHALIQATVDRWFSGDPDALRKEVCALACSYANTQYRWGGKSDWGIDCSGLISACYMQCGVLIYRNARMLEGWPMHQIERAAVKPGDALFFPGHVAIYLGDGHYVHSTGAAAVGGVTVNSLDPAAPDYRRDLDEGLYAAGTIF